MKDLISETDWIIHALNIQGDFFEKFCESEIRKLNKLEIVQTDYQFTSESKNQHGSFDILAKYNDLKNNIHYKLIIECKKRNPEFVKWIFFKNNFSKNEISFIRIQEGESCIFSVKSSIPFADKASEVRGNYISYSSKKNEKTKTLKTAIQDAVNQVTLGYFSVAKQALKESELALKEAKRFSQILVPVVITTADLFICKYSPNDISGIDGTIDVDKCEILPTDMVIYEFTPNENPLSIARDSLSDFQDSRIRTMQVIVINSTIFQKFLESFPVIPAQYP